jgi:hypothetical protein
LPHSAGGGSRPESCRRRDRCGRPSRGRRPRRQGWSGHSRTVRPRLRLQRVCAVLPAGQAGRRRLDRAPGSYLLLIPGMRAFSVQRLRVTGVESHGTRSWRDSHVICLASHEPVHRPADGVKHTRSPRSPRSGNGFPFARMRATARGTGASVDLNRRLRPSARPRTSTGAAASRRR